MEWVDRGSELVLEDTSIHRSHRLPHLTEILHDMERRLFADRVRARTEQDSREKLAQFEKGFILEQILRIGLMARQLGRSVEDLLGHDQEIEKDGVLLNPDEVNLRENELEEYKATARSMRRFEEGDAETEFWSWFMQVKAYCYVKRIPRARLVVFWVCGDYKPPFPRFRTYRVSFTKEELKETWAAILNHKRFMEKEGLPTGQQRFCCSKEKSDGGSEES